MDTHSDNSASERKFPEREPDLSHLSPESAAIYKKLTAREEMRPMSAQSRIFAERPVSGNFSEERSEETSVRPASPDSSAADAHFDGAKNLTASLRRDEWGEREFQGENAKLENRPSKRRAYHFEFQAGSIPTRNGLSIPEASAEFQEETALKETSPPTLSEKTAANENLAESEAELPASSRILRISRTAEAAAASRETLMEVSQLKKGYVKGKVTIPVLRGVDLQVQEGEFLAIVGQSGSGKSTLLHLMGTLDIPDSGSIHFDGQRIDNLPSRQRDHLRNRYIGMIFQFYHLIPEMTMIENVLAPLMIRESCFGYWRHRRSYIKRAKELLDLVGLSHRIHHKPNELSGGEMQRTSIARALITDPRILLADEPTGNLDSKTTLEIIKLLRTLNREQKLTIVMVTHDMEQAADADRVIRLVDGQVVDNFMMK